MAKTKKMESEQPIASTLIKRREEVATHSKYISKIT